MFGTSRIFFTVAFIGSLSFPLAAQQTRDYKTSELVGKVSFPVSCTPGVQQEFNQAVALLHSFAYTTAKDAFQKVAEQDPACAIAHWGIAMTYFHELWDPPISLTSLPLGQAEIQQAQQLGARSERERGFIAALALIYKDASTVPYRTRVLNYERAMDGLAAENRKDIEAQVFYALALLANASPADKTHQEQKQALDLLEPLYRVYPQHPGIAHYIIHACDNAELAPRGLPAARAYAKIAPSVPHALHMPSHIFTRLGLWDDSIASNVVSRDAARQQGDTGEELHAMDYLVYAYLQSGRDSDAADVIEQLKKMPANFKIGYPATAMPVRFAIERQQWSDAVNIVPPAAELPQVVAIAVWAQGFGLARSGRAAESVNKIDKLQQLEEQLRTSGNDYWATQVEIMKREVMAWSAQANHQPDQAVTLLREAADEEDAVEKLPVTPGPIVPAREQLGDLLLEQNHPELASKVFEIALANAPGRRGALQGAAKAAKLIGKM